MFVCLFFFFFFFKFFLSGSGCKLGFGEEIGGLCWGFPNVRRMNNSRVVVKFFVEQSSYVLPCISLACECAWDLFLGGSGGGIWYKSISEMFGLPICFCFHVFEFG